MLFLCAVRGSQGATSGQFGKASEKPLPLWHTSYKKKREGGEKGKKKKVGRSGANCTSPPPRYFGIILSWKNNLSCQVTISVTFSSRPLSLCHLNRIVKDSMWEGKERKKKKSVSFAYSKKPLLNKTQCLHLHTSCTILSFCSMEIGVYSLESCGNSLKCISEESPRCRLIWNAVQQVSDVYPAISQCITLPLSLFGMLPVPVKPLLLCWMKHYW